MGYASESLRGSNASGSDGNPNRVITLGNTSLTIASGFKVYVNGLLLVSTTEYTISHGATGTTVTFLNALFDTDYVFIEYTQGISSYTSNYTDAATVYSRSGLTSSEVNLTTNAQILTDTDAEIDLLVGRKFTDGNTITEYFDGARADIFGNNRTKIRLTKYPVQTITSFLVLNQDGTTSVTLDTLSSSEVQSDDYWMDTQIDPLTDTTIRTGEVQFKTREVPQGKQVMKVVYTYGYSTVPVTITQLATCIAGIKAWIQFIGGQYNRFNSYSIPQQNVDKGDFYQRGLQMITSLTDEANRLLDRIGRKQRTLAYSTGSGGV